MIFNTFDDTDIVSGRITRVASGFWPGGVTNWSQSLFQDDFWDLTGSSVTPFPSYGATLYDVRRTMYYVNVFPSANEHANHDPYFSATYGNVNGSGSFLAETASIRATPTKEIYTLFKNLLLGTSNLNGLFAFETGSTGGTVTAQDIFVLNFSTYKMKDRIDEGLLQLSFSGSNGCFTFIDDSSTQAQVGTVYNLISGSLATGIFQPGNYQGIGLFYPQNGIIVLNAEELDDLVGLSTANYSAPGGTIGDGSGPFNYSSTSFNNPYTQNQRVIVESLRYAGGDGTNSPELQMSVRKSEFVPAVHYFIRVKNRDFNYSNNPTYVFDGTDGIHAQGTIRNSDFISDPRTYPTTVGLYDDSNELVAVAKLSRPALKSFDNELLIKVRLDF